MTRRRAPRVVAGQRFWDVTHTLFIAVTRVSADGKWADIRVAPPGVPEAGGWGKRQRLVDGWFPFEVVQLVEDDVPPTRPTWLAEDPDGFEMLGHGLDDVDDVPAVNRRADR